MSQIHKCPHCGEYTENGEDEEDLCWLCEADEIAQACQDRDNQD